MLMLVVEWYGPDFMVDVGVVVSKEWWLLWLVWSWWTWTWAGA